MPPHRDATCIEPLAVLAPYPSCLRLDYQNAELSVKYDEIGFFLLNGASINHFKHLIRVNDSEIIG